MNTTTLGCTRRFPIIQTTVFAALLLSAGCASLDASRELDLAANAAQRVGGSLTPAEAWSLSVQDESPAWNGAEPLNYDDAVAVALQGDPALRRALAVIIERRAWYVQQGLPPNPTVAFGIGAAIDGLSGAPMMVQGMQMLSWIWKNPHRVDAAGAELRAAVYDAADRCVILMTKTRTQLASVIAAQHMLALEMQYVDITQQTVDLVRSMQEAGELAHLDLDRAIVDHQKAVAAMSASEHALLDAQLNLLGTMGRPDEDTMWVAEGDLPPAWDIPADETTLLALAATGRLDVAARLEVVRQLHAELGLAETRRFPDVGFNLTYQKNFGERKALMPGASVTLPILDNGDPAVAIQVAKIEQAQMELLSAIEVAQQQVRMSFNRYLDARSQVEIIRGQQLGAAIAAQERSDAAYTEGEVDLNTLLLTQRQRINVERSLVQQEYKTMQAMCDLRRAVGGSFDPVQNMIPVIEIEARSLKTNLEGSS
jgi:outer membrane protein TolC